jgi:ribosomal protein S27AE
MATVRVLEKNLTGRDSRTGSVRCSRCGGFMAVEGAFDLVVGVAPIDVLVRRCVQCGEVVDSVILQNRRLQGGNDLGRPQRRDTSHENVGIQ